MNQQTVDLLKTFGSEIKEYIAQIAQGLGVASEYVYRVLVKQQIVEGIALMSYWAFGLLIFAVSAGYFSKAMKKYRAEEDSCRADDIFFSHCLAPLIVMGISFLFLIFTFKDNFIQGLTHVINPEYYALQQIVEYVKGVIGK